VTKRSLVIAAAINDEQILATTLALSPDLKNGSAELIPVRGALTASTAYNEVLENTSSDLVVFVHQDVYLPTGWVAQVLSEVDRLDSQDPCWAVCGVYGVAADGQHLGRLWSGDQRSELRGSGGGSGEVASLDEVVLILRTDVGLRFDQRLPHFHLYGTDIVQIAASQRRTSYVVDAPIVHNTVPVASLGGGFTAGYRFLQQKWATRLPIATSMTTLTRYGLPLIRARAAHWWHFGRPTRLINRVPRLIDVVGLAKRVGYEQEVHD